MGFLSDIKDKIFGRHDEPVTQTAEASPAPQLSPQPTTASTAGTSPSPAPQAAPAPTAAPSTVAAPASAPAQSQVDVSAVLDEAVKTSAQTLDWRKSIVDLMKALDLDSSLAERKALAKELHYTGDTEDSATMNVWLHKALLKKLSENGGKVPADLLD